MMLLLFTMFVVLCTASVILVAEGNDKYDDTSVLTALVNVSLRQYTEVSSISAADRQMIFDEVKKQAIDQPLHFVMAGGPIWLSHYLTRVPWYGWSIMPLLAYREWCQWPSTRWWDPPLDAPVFVLGAVVATWRARAGAQPSRPLRWRRVGARLCRRSRSADVASRHRSDRIAWPAR